MNRHKPIVGIGLALLVALLAACAARPVTPAAPSLTTPPPGTEAAAPVSTAASSAAEAEGLARSDAQGAVEFVVTPLNLGAVGATLDFDVSMDTHSVDLGWDLAAQSVLTTDTGLEVPGLSWPVGNGHHYEGTLSFPAVAGGGKPLLDGATALTLTIRNTDVPERAFSWSLVD